MKYSDYTVDAEYQVFRQKELKTTVSYDTDYVKVRYENIETADPLSELRAKVLLEFVGEKYNMLKVLDYGCGAGTFVETIKKYPNVFCEGFDVSPYPTSFKKLTEELAMKVPFDVVTFFDSLEHLVDPFGTITKLDAKYVFISVPECHYPFDPKWFLNWKHRRPGEHLWHFTRESLDHAMNKINYAPLLHSNFEDKIRTPYSFYLSNILSALYQKY